MQLQFMYLLETNCNVVCDNRIEVLPMKDASKAIEGVWNGKARYRYVLVQDIEKH